MPSILIQWLMPPSVSLTKKISPLFLFLGSWDSACISVMFINGFENYSLWTVKCKGISFLVCPHTSNSRGGDYTTSTSCVTVWCQQWPTSIFCCVKIRSISRRVQIQGNDLSHPLLLSRWVRCPEFFGVWQNTTGQSSDMGVTGIEITREAVSKKE